MWVMVQMHSMLSSTSFKGSLLPNNQSIVASSFLLLISLLHSDPYAFGRAGRSYAFGNAATLDVDEAGKALLRRILNGAAPEVRSRLFPFRDTLCSTWI